MSERCRDCGDWWIWWLRAVVTGDCGDCRHCLDFFLWLYCRMLARWGSLPTLPRSAWWLQLNQCQRRLSCLASDQRKQKNDEKLANVRNEPNNVSRTQVHSVTVIGNNCSLTCSEFLCMSSWSFTSNHFNTSNHTTSIKTHQDSTNFLRVVWFSQRPLQLCEQRKKKNFSLRGRVCWRQFREYYFYIACESCFICLQKEFKQFLKSRQIETSLPNSFRVCDKFGIWKCSCTLLVFLPRSRVPEVLWNTTIITNFLPSNCLISYSPRRATARRNFGSWNRIEKRLDFENLDCFFLKRVGKYPNQMWERVFTCHTECVSKFSSLLH